MKFDTEKMYRTRDKKRARIFFYDVEHGGTMIGAIKCADGWLEIKWNADGKLLQNGSNHDFDLVAEWREPFKLQMEGWVNRNTNYEHDFEWDVFSLRPIKHNKTELCDIKVRITVEEIP